MVWRFTLIFLRLSLPSPVVISCNGAIVSDADGGEVVQMSGDQRTNIHEFLVDQKICAASQVKRSGNPHNRPGGMVAWDHETDRAKRCTVAISCPFFLFSFSFRFPFSFVVSCLFSSSSYFHALMMHSRPASSFVFNGIMCCVRSGEEQFIYSVCPCHHGIVLNTSPSAGQIYSIFAPPLLCAMRGR